MTAVPDIQRSRAEQARLDFVGGLMAFNSTGFGPAMGAWYRDNETRLSDPSDIREVGGLMEQGNAYRFGAFFERHNHAQMFRAILDILERQGEEVRAWLDDCNPPGALGSLELDPDLETPRYYRKIEIHTQPGNYHAEFAGILYHWMISPFLVGRDDGDEMGWNLARAVPEGDYRRILDLGCGVGKSTFPYCELYPDAEVVGLDYAASMLKYGHKLAESRGHKVHFTQRLAEDTGYPDESFDVVSAVWLFHELPGKVRAAVVREAFRLLRPGGVFAIMESPPFKVLQEEYSPLSAFLLDSTGRRMEDPFLPGFLAEDRVRMFEEGGFSEVRDLPLPNELTGWGFGGEYFFGAYPWWATIGVKA